MTRIFFVFLKCPIWRKEIKSNELWTDSDDAELRFYLREKYAELSNKELVADIFRHYANARSFNPIEKYFDNLPKWDGKKRAEELFINWLRVKDSPFSRQATKIWLLAAMSRALKPGCTFQAAIVLQGPQCIGKSHILEMLGGEWYGVLNDNVDDSHAIDAIQNKWIVEMKEMSAARKADVNKIKSFLDASSDNRRAAYERKAADVPRPNVFAITVNDENFLRDRTGNRRFWILKSQSKMFDFVKEVDGKVLDENYIKQVWAEVKVMYAEMFKNGFNDKFLRLSAENEIIAEKIASGFLQDDGLQGEIQAFVDIPIPENEIWELLTKDERNKFFKENQIKLYADDIQKRYEAKHGRKGCADFAAIISKYRDTYTNDNGQQVTNLCKIYGAVKREHICAAEIRNEYFAANDKRISAQALNEILPQIEGWELGKQIKRDSAYGDQKKVFWRKPETDSPAPTAPTDSTNEKEIEPATDDFATNIDEIEVPF